MLASLLVCMAGVTSGLFAYAHCKANELNEIVRHNLPIIDDLLARLISPEERIFTVEELARKFRFPDVDLSEIDSDWW